MKDRSVLEEARFYFMPFILGSNRLAHGLSAKIFIKYGITSHILDNKRTAWDIFDLISRFITLSSRDPRLVCEEIIALGEQEPYTLPILIAATDEYKTILEKHRQLLEPYFVISDADKLFESSPLADIK